jgi:alanine racemase
VAYHDETVDAAAAAGLRHGVTIPLHLKVETGNQRQGLEADECVALAQRIVGLQGVSLEGASTHYADIEDTTNHSFARLQRERFETAIAAMDAAGVRPAMIHASNSASAILWPGVHTDLVRVGIGCYGLWPSRETYITALMVDRHDVELRPAMTWKARIAQVRDVPAGETVGYGRTHRTTHDSRLAVVSIGYWDGYDRRLSNQAHVLIQGQRAPVLGRVCMNLMMVDVSHVAEAQTGDEVVLLGASGEERITAEQMADWIGTIQYEVPTRIHARLVRHVVE